MEKSRKVFSFLFVLFGLLMLIFTLMFLPFKVGASVLQPRVEIIREIDIVIDERIKLPTITVVNEVISDTAAKEIDIEIGEPVVKTININPMEEIQRNQDIDLLARLIEAEAGLDSIPFGEKVCVGLTVLHRVDDPAFPNNIRSNVYIGNQYTVPSEIASETSIKAAKRAFELWESGESYDYLPSEALYFKGDGKNNHFHDKEGNKYEDLDILSQENPDDEILEILLEDEDILSNDTIDISISDEIIIKEETEESEKDILEL